MPDVFILGFTKCATTSLYNQLTQHPDVSNTKRKEPHYHFSKVMGASFKGPADDDAVAQMFVTNKQKYKALYEPGKIAIDGSAMSVEHPDIMIKINEEYPNAKCIIMLRNPLQRAFSAYTHLLRDARENLSFSQALEQEINGARSDYLPIWQNLQSSRFVEATQFARSLFKSRLLVVNYDEYINNNAQVMDKVSHFLELSQITWRPDNANRSGVPHSATLQKVIMRKSLLKTAFISLFPESFVTKLKRLLLEKNTGKKPTLSSADRDFFLTLISDERAKILPNTPDTQLLESMYSS